MSKNTGKTTPPCNSTSGRMFGYYRTGHSCFVLEMLSIDTFSTKHTTDSRAHPTS
jgi:hypothetical protein